MLKDQITWCPLQLPSTLAMEKERLCVDGFLIIFWASRESTICSSLEFWATELFTLPGKKNSPGVTGNLLSAEAEHAQSSCWLGLQAFLK